MSTTPKSVKIGLIGAGKRLAYILKNIREADPEGRIQVTTAFDPSAGSHEELRTFLGYDYRKAESEEAVVNDPELDWVFIGSWNSQHARQAVLALNAGKNVFCEKPLATSLGDCLAIREAAERSGKTFSFGLVLRYSAHYQEIVEKLNSGAIGKIISFEFNETLNFNHGGYIFGNWRRFRENAGTHLLEKCCHDIDLANWIINSLPVQAASFGGRDIFIPENAGLADKIGPNKDGVKPYKSWPDPDGVSPFDGSANIFDNQVAILQYANGVRGTFHTNCNTSIAERRFYICGTEGTLRADLLTGAIEVKRIGWETESEISDSKSRGGHGGGDAVMGRQLVATMLEGAAPMASVNEGLYSAIAAFGLDAAADSRCVTDLMPMWRQAGIDPSAVKLR